MAYSQFACNAPNYYFNEQPMLFQCIQTEWVTVYWDKCLKHQNNTLPQKMQTAKTLKKNKIMQNVHHYLCNVTVCKSKQSQVLKLVTILATSSRLV